MGRFILKSVKWFDRLIRNYELLLVIFVGVLITPNVVLLFTEPYSFLTKVISIVLPATIYLWFLTARPNIGVMMLWSFPIMFYGAFQIVIMKLFNGSYVAVDMFTNLFTTTSGEAGELLASLTSVIIFVVVLYGGALLVSIHTARRGALGGRRLRLIIRRYTLSTFAVSVALTVLQSFINPLFSFREHVFPFNVVENTVIAFQRESQKYNYYETSADFSFDATREVADSTGREIYVLIVGETSRAANYSLYGYHRNTNPRLSTIENIIVAPDLISQGNATHKIVPLLLSAVAAENFEDIYEHKSIVSAFKQTGFETFFISNQPPNGSFTDYFSKEADNHVNLTLLRNDGVVMPDDITLPELQKAIENTDKNIFVIIHTYGSHFNYSARYGEQFARFQSDDTSEISEEFKDNLFNAYDNSILQTDSFVADVIDMVEKQQCVSSVVFMSDHGEDLLDDQRGLFLHSSPVPSYYQLHVPFITWFSNSYTALNGSKVENYKKNSLSPLSSEVLFHTVIDIASIQTPYLNTQQSLSSQRFQSKERYFLNDRNRAVEFYNTGVGEHDFKMFKKHNIYIDSTKVVTLKY